MTIAERVAANEIHIDYLARDQRITKAEFTARFQAVEASNEEIRKRIFNGVLWLAAGAAALVASMVRAKIGL